MTYRKRLKDHAHRTSRRVFWDAHDREDYECPGCGRQVLNYEVHHRDGDWLNNHPLNLVAVCHACHRRAHRLKKVSERLDEMREEVAAMGADA